jgi:ankyrin repeat protein
MESVDAAGIAEYTIYRLVFGAPLTVNLFMKILAAKSRKEEGLMETVAMHGSPIRKGEGIMQNVNAKDRNGHTPLIDAAKEGDLDAVKDLLHRGAEVDASSEKGKTALHYAAANGHVETVKFLLEHGAQVDARDKQWRTPLMLAAIYGCNHTIQALLSAGADTHARTLVGNTPLIYAENNEHPLAAALLKKAQRLKETTA